MINEKGQCCGRKPLAYKGRRADRQLLCCRCDRSYDLDTKQQRENFAWVRNEAGEFVSAPPKKYSGPAYVMRDVKFP